MKKLLIILFMLVTPCFGAQDVYQFTTIEQQQRFESLTTGLRCLVCQNQNIAESNAGLANDLRENIYQQILNGKADKEIIDYLVNRYGDYILYHPPVNGQTILLWIGPFIFLVLAISYFLFYVRKKQREH